MATESATDGAVGDAAASEVDRLVALLADRDARIVELEGTVSTLVRCTDTFSLHNCDYLGRASITNASHTPRIRLPSPP